MKRLTWIGYAGLVSLFVFLSLVPSAKAVSVEVYNVTNNSYRIDCWIGTSCGQSTTGRWVWTATDTGSFIGAASSTVYMDYTQTGGAQGWYLQLSVSSGNNGGAYLDCRTQDVTIPNGTVGDVLFGNWTGTECDVTASTMYSMYVRQGSGGAVTWEMDVFAVRAGGYDDERTATLYADDGTTGDSVTFDSPRASSSRPTQFNWIVSYEASTTVSGALEVNVCPYLTSCGRIDRYLANFVANPAGGTATFYTITPLSPGAKTAVVYLKNAATGATIATDTVYFTVTGDTYSTSTTQASSSVTCSFNLALVGEIDPCATAYWLIVPPIDPDTGNYVTIQRYLDIPELAQTIFPFSVWYSVTDTLSTSTADGSNFGTLRITVPTGANTTTTVTILSTSTINQYVSSGMMTTFKLIFVTSLWLLLLYYLWGRFVDPRDSVIQ